jgi:hypothetical protein
MDTLKTPILLGSHALVTRDKNAGDLYPVL